MLYTYQLKAPTEQVLGKYEPVQPIQPTPTPNPTAWWQMPAQQAPAPQYPLDTFAPSPYPNTQYHPAHSTYPVHPNHQDYGNHPGAPPRPAAWDELPGAARDQV